MTCEAKLPEKTIPAKKPKSRREERHERRRFHDALKLPATSETITNNNVTNTYNYAHEDITATHDFADRVNTKDGVIERLPDQETGGASESLCQDASCVKRCVPKPSVDKAVGERPALDELVADDPHGHLVEAMRGSIDYPNITNSVLKDDIFIDGKVSEEDVRQGAIGDCYFLAAVLQVIRHEPSAILNMMKVRGEEVMTTFYRKDGNRWVQQDIVVKMGVFTENKKWKSSRYRIAYNPTYAT